MAAIEGAAAALDARVSATESGIEENGAGVAGTDARLEAMWLRLRSSRFALFSVQFGIGAALDQAAADAVTEAASKMGSSGDIMNAEPAGLTG